MSRAVLIVLCFIMFFIGWLANGISQAEKANASKKIEYKVVSSVEWRDGSGYSMGPEKIENILNTYGKEGWKLHSSDGAAHYLIFER